MAQGLGGILLHPGRARDLGSVSIDSRSLRMGEVFLALRGENLDGHDYLPRALQGGAAALVAETFSPAVRRLALKSGAAMVQVKDSLRGLQALAADQRRLF